MTSVGNVATTGFEQNPKKEAVLVDAYKPTQINNLNVISPVVDTPVDTLSGKLPAEQASMIKSDPLLQKELAKTGLSLEQYVANIEKEIPPGTDTTQLFREYSLVDLARDSSRAITAMRGRGVDTKSSSFFSTVIGYMQQPAGVVDLNSYANNLQLEKVNGNSNYVDEIGEIAVSLGLIKSNIFLGQIAGFYDILGDLGNSPTFGRYAVEEAMTIGAQEGSYQAVKDILISYPNKASDNLRQQCVMWILENFRASQADLSLGYFNAAKIMVDALDAISPGWQMVDGFYNHKLWIKASTDAVALLVYDERTQISAGIQNSYKYKLDAWLPTAKAQYPNLILI